MDISNKKRACVVVLGDIGRSPRMQYHINSLLAEDFRVDVIGYLENEPLAEISSSKNVKIHDMTQFPELSLWSLIKYILKTIWQTLTLFAALFSIQKPNFILVQNPPAIPTFPVCYFYCLLFRCKFVIDWHNYTHSILALNSKNRNFGLIPRMAKFCEGFFGSRANSNFCVTKSMKLDLEKNWNINSTILYDRPPNQFHPITVDKKHEIFMKLSKNYSEFLPKDCGDFKEKGVIESTSLTQKMSDGRIVCKINRPAILISSTSWTPDEDFSILLEALEDYEKTAKDSKLLPKIICIITGKGPQKDFYKNIINKLKWVKVSILTPWLEAEDYPLVVASADLGVCLHWSSSGLDLPMKVVDMFGCGLPVCAMNFKCLDELVIHEENGFVFNDSNQLAFQLKHWFRNFPNNSPDYKEKFKENLQKFLSLRWNENWRLNALPTLNSL